MHIYVYTFDMILISTACKLFPNANINPFFCRIANALHCEGHFGDSCSYQTAFIDISL